MAAQQEAVPPGPAHDEGEGGHHSKKGERHRDIGQRFEQLASVDRSQHEVQDGNGHEQCPDRAYQPAAGDDSHRGGLDRLA
jgi:hypothetical protein